MGDTSPMGWAALGKLWQERKQRFAPSAGVRARTLIGSKRQLHLGVSERHYRFFCGHQLKRTCLSKWELSYHGLKHIPKDSPLLFVMKHRGFTDITLHGFGHAWATSDYPIDGASPWSRPETLNQVLSTGRACRFVMKEELLCLHIGAHLVLNGGIPVPQDLETKAKNTPGFDPSSPEVREKQAQMGPWFSFKDSYREIINTLRSRGSVMIYGEATRVDGDRMGHLSLNMIERLARTKGTLIIPVGTRLNDRSLEVHYDAPCTIDDLRDNIARLSGITTEHYL